MQNYQKKTNTNSKKRHGKLPSIDNKDVRYNADLKSQNSKLEHNNQNESKKTLAVMNVTFNSRPGVSNYVVHLVGSGTANEEEVIKKNQLPHAGYRKNRRHGYSNFYFSSKLNSNRNSKMSSPTLEETKLKRSENFSMIGAN